MTRAKQILPSLMLLLAFAGIATALDLPKLLGAHPWWSTKVIWIGVPVGLVLHALSASVSDPFLHGENSFAVIFEVQGKVKESGEAFDMREVGVYHVVNGKIVREEFFY